VRVLICGSRDWRDAERLAQVLDSLPSGSVVIHGAGRGAEKLAAELAAAHGLGRW